MRGDPEFDRRLDALYSLEREKKRRNLRFLRAIVSLLGFTSIIVLLTWDYRPTRAAAVPFLLGFVLLKLFDPHWRSLNFRFTFGYILFCGSFYLLRLFLILAS